MSIADKLVTIAEKLPKVYHAGQLNVLANAESLNGSLSGKRVSANDVIGIEHNIPCQLTSDTITDFSSVKVSKYGKNLINYKNATLSNATIIEKLENGIIARGNLGATQPNAYANGWVSVNYDNSYKDYQVKLNANDIVTISCDYTLLELAEGRTENQVVNILLYGTNPHSNPDAAYNKPKLGKTIRLYVTYTVKETGVYYPVFSLNSNLVKIENIQIQIGTTETNFEPYIEPTTYTANADGTVEGITSIAPSMTLLSNTEGVVINANYYKDPDIVISNLAQSVALSGGEG